MKICLVTYVYVFLVMYVPIYSTHNLSLIATVPLDELFFNILKVGGAELINQIRMDPFTF
jgi:hypothetical protein